MSYQMKLLRQINLDKDAWTLCLYSLSGTSICLRANDLFVVCFTGSSKGVNGYCLFKSRSQVSMANVITHSSWDLQGPTTKCTPIVLSECVPMTCRRPEPGKSPAASGSDFLPSVCHQLLSHFFQRAALQSRDLLFTPCFRKIEGAQRPLQDASTNASF